MLANVEAVYPEPLDTFLWNIRGVPCQVVLMAYISGEPAGHASFNIHGELTDPGSPAEEPIVEYEIWDVHGQYAPHLEDLVGVGEYVGIVNEVERRRLTQDVP